MNLFKNAHIFVMLLLFLSSTLVNAFPLSTSNRWIVDKSGKRVKLACVNWPAHLQPAVPEGLQRRPLDDISKRIKSMGFNCVRLTWPLYLVTNASYAKVTMRESLNNFGLKKAIKGAQNYNPTLLDQTLIQVFKEVVWNLDKNGIMVILDNHVTTPGWCCSGNDGNGFFGDKYFNPDEWISGLTQMAQMFTKVKNVVGMSLRNELRGGRQNVDDWYKYMQMGAEAVHKANPNVLVIVSGISSGRDLTFLATRDFSVSFKDKIVYEVHWYSFTMGGGWNLNANDACADAIRRLMNNAGFLMQKGLPFFLSEWGIDMRGPSPEDNKYLGCLLGWAAEMDVDWSLWALQGSYYLRQGVVEMEEFYGALNLYWDRVRNPGFLKRISALQSPFQGPGLNAKAHMILFHPATGNCVIQRTQLSPLRLGSCQYAKGWSYNNKDETIQLLYGTNLYMKAEGSGKAVSVTEKKNDDDQSFVWNLISNSGMHISTKYGNGLCLDVEKDNSIVTYGCRCLTKARSCDPMYQWFKLVPSTTPF